MRILIVYQSHTGTVRTCVEQLSRELSRLDVDLCDLDERVLLPADYDAVILGGYIHADRLPKEMTRYIKAFSEDMLKRPLGLFLCCGYLDNYEDYVRKNFPAELVDHAFLTIPFGGELKPEKARGMDRLLLRIIRSTIQNAADHNEHEYTRVMPEILPENISRMASMLKGALQSIGRG